MATDITRKKLNKLIGKTVGYRATYLQRDCHGKRALLKNVTYQGKLITDHVWVALAYTLEILERNTEVKFKGIAFTYTDKQGKRKNGINKCHNYHVYNDGVEQAHEDSKQRYLRCNR